MVLLDIVLIEGHDLPSTKFPAILRSQDIRSFETDSVEVYSSYRPGDIVRAQIISLGDARSYYISTAKNDLGVIYSVGRGGVAMEVLSSEAMECPLTKTVEKRKVALTAQVKIE
jgi:exosome complex component CSL4